MKSLEILFFILVMKMPVWAQQNQIYLAHKSETREFELQHSQRLEINTERTELQIQTWDKPLIKMDITYSAKHESKSQATKELNYLELLSQAKGKVFYIRSAVKIPSNREKPTASLSLKIVLVVPKEIQLTLYNKLGKVLIENANLKGSLYLELTHFSMSNSSFEGELTQRFGESKIDKSKFNGTINLYRSKANWDDLIGEIQLIGESGRWQIAPPALGLNLHIKSSKSDITLYGPHLPAYRIEAAGDYSNYSISNEIPFNRERSGAITIGANHSNQKIVVSNVLGNIHVSKNK